MKVGFGLVAIDPRLIQRYENSTDILMFEFDRAFIPVNQSHQRTAMFSLAVWPSRQLIKEHGEVVCELQNTGMFTLREPAAA